MRSPTWNCRAGEMVLVGLPNAGPGRCSVPHSGGPSVQPAFSAPMNDSGSKLGWLTTLNTSSVGMSRMRSLTWNGRDSRRSQT